MTSETGLTADYLENFNEEELKLFNKLETLKTPSNKKEKKIKEKSEKELFKFRTKNGKKVLINNIDATDFRDTDEDIDDDNNEEEFSSSDGSIPIETTDDETLYDSDDEIDVISGREGLKNSEIIKIETIHEERLNMLLSMEELDLIFKSKIDKNTGKRYDIYDRLKIYRDQRVAKGKYKVIYRRRCNYGRYTASCGFGLQTLPRPIANFLVEGIYQDYDIQNCHPILLEHLFEKHGISTKELKEYNKNRENVLKKYRKSKQYFLSMINDYNKKFKKGDEFFEKIHKKIYKELITKLMTNEYKFIWDDLEKKSIKDNKEGKFISLVLQDIENTILQKIIEKMEKMNKEVDVLIFDGFYHNGLTTNDINDLEYYIKNVLDYSITIVNKPMQYSKTKEGKDTKFKDLLTEENIEKFNEEIIFENQKEVAEALINKHKNDIVKIDKNLFYIRSGSIYISNKDDKILHNIFEGWIMDCPYIIKKGIVQIKVNGYESSWNGIIRCIETYIRTYIHEQFELKNKIGFHKGFIVFKNGAYDVVKKRFIDVSKKEYNDIGIYPTSFINVNFEKVNVDKNGVLFTKILNPVFNDDEKTRDEFFKYISRALTNFVDKNYLFCKGARDCGKSMITKLLEYSFTSDIIGAINLDSFKKSSTNLMEEERFKSQFEPFTSKKIIISNEGRCDTLDGNLLKSVSSGVDNLVFRKSYGRNTRSEVMRGRPLFFVNDMPLLEPFDAYNNMLYYEFRCKFVDNPDNRGKKYYVERKKDDNIYDLFTKDILMMFINYVLECFDENGGYPLLKENTDEFKDNSDLMNLETKVKSFFEFDCNKVLEKNEGNDHDKYRISVKDICSILNMKAMTKELSIMFEDMGAERIKVKGNRYYRYMRRVVINDNDGLEFIE